MEYKNKPCPKAGIKIHETSSNIKSNINEKYSLNLNGEINNFDFNLENYTLDKLYKLFNIDQINDGLNEKTMKNAKLFTLKTHPDKSRLDPKYYIFYSKAYNKLNEIYEYKNKSSKKFTLENNYSDEFSEYYNEDKKSLMDKFIENNKHLSKTSNFNGWFNEQFEKYGIDNSKQDGYGDWFKSNENMMEFNEKVTLENFNDKFNKQKKEIYALSVYKSSFENNEDFSFQSIGSDLKEVYSQTIIPVSEDDFNKVNRYKNVNEYKNVREKQDIKPIDGTEAQKILYNQKLKDEETSTAQAFKYAQELEKNKKQNEGFWSSLKFLTNF
jgi:hypothetical protein